MTNSNLEKGVPWRFGPDWPGQRCGAKTRKGTPCQRAAKLPVGRCRLHGGVLPPAQGPRTACSGLQRLVRPTVNTPKTSGQRSNSGPRWGGRCARSWLSLRNGSWTTGIWTRNGGISSNKGPEVNGILDKLSYFGEKCC